MRFKLMLMLLFLAAQVSAGGLLVVNEIQSDPDGTIGDANGDGTVDTSQDEFIEIYNDTGGVIDVSGWTISDAVQVRHTFPAGSVITNECSLVVFGGGTPTGTFGNALVQTASTGTLGLNNGGDSVILNDGNSDVLTESYGSSAGDNQSITRDPDISGSFVKHSLATGSGGSLFSPGTLINGSQFSGCSGGGDIAPTVTSTIPVDAATSVAADSSIVINFSEAIDATISAVSVTCDAQNQTFSGLPASGVALNITPDADLPFDANCVVDVVAAQVTDQDGTPDNMAVDYQFSFTVESEAQSQIDLILNEYQADPDSTNGDANGDGTADFNDDEFIEIYNNGPNTVDLSGWTLADGNSVRHTFDNGTLLDSCKAIVVFGGGTPTGSFGGSLTTVASSGSLGLNNGGDSIVLNDGDTDRINLNFGSSGTNQSYTLDPDITGMTFVEHSGATGSGGALFSPGTQIDGTPFVPCGGTPLPPRVNSTIPVDGASAVAIDSNITIEFSENVDATINAVNFTCGMSNIAVAGLPLTNDSILVLDPNADLPNGEFCTVELVATEITDLDDTPDELDGDGDGTGGDNYSFQFIAGTPELEIFDIQGDGMASSYDGVRVSTMNNIVTALDTNGFYMQTPDARDDMDPKTSNGIFVYTGNNMPVSVGDEINLTGDIVEFFGLTEFTNPGTYDLTIVNSGVTLPTAVMLDDNFPPTDPTVFPCVDEALEYECLEGMWFDMPQGFISSASVSFFGANSEDQFVKAGTSRAFREPGIEYPGLMGLPVFDGNPELLEMDVDALGLDLAANSYPAGSEISVTGVFGYDFGEYEIWPASVDVINENVIPSSVRDAMPDEVTIGSANLFRLFNDVDDPGPEDDDQIADTMEYADRLTKLARYIVDDMKAPTIIALQEIENDSVLQDLTSAIGNYGGPNYISTMIEGNDQGGIDVAYLYQAGTLSNVQVTQLGAAEINSFDGSLLHDRPPLKLEAEALLSQGTLPLNVLVVHLRSRGGIDDAVDGERVRSKRLQQANSVAAMVQSIMNEDPDVGLYVLGDFNAFQFTDGYVDVIGQITGEAVETDNLLWEEPLFVNSPLTQAVQTLTANQQYSFVFRGSAQVLDNAIMNDEGLMNLTDMQYIRGQADANINNQDDNSTSLRSTDHDGFVLFIYEDNDLIFRNGFE
jgi:predicted extracellular nuclease/methionine-rich copper-binding protein CopC